MAHRLRLTISLFLLALLLSCQTGALPSAVPPSATPTALQPGPTLPSVTLAPTAIATVTPTPIATLPPQELNGQTIEFWHPWPGAAAIQAQAMVEEFNASNPWGIRVQVRALGGNAALSDAAALALATGTAPDLIASTPDQINAWQKAGIPLINLTPYLQDPTWGLSAAQQAEFYPTFWLENSNETGQWSVPALRTARVIYYNQTWANELGFPNPPRTPKEFRNIACASARSLRLDANPDNDGLGGWVLDSDALTLLGWLWAFDWQGIPATDNQTYTFQSSQAQAAFEFWRGLLDQNCAWVNRSVTPNQAFANRQAILFTGEAGDLSLQSRLMARANNQDAWVILPFPTQAQTSLLLTHGQSYALFASTPPRQLAAWAFTRWMLETSQHARLAQAADGLPLSRSAWDLLSTVRSTQTAWQPLMQSLEAARPAPALASWRTVRHLLEDAAWQLRQPYSSQEKIPAILQQLDAMSQEEVQP